MPAQDDVSVSTIRFCISSADGSIAPAWDDRDEAQLEGEFEVGRTVADRYLLQQKLGNGSMGRVFLAKDLRLDRSVALKVVLHGNRGIADLESLLEQEAKLGASLNHRGIAAVYDFGFHEDKSYTVFEFVEGETLRSVIQRRGRMPLDEVLPIVEELAVALDFAHVQGVIHRDLKPENICRTRSGEFKILDLGLAYDARRVFRKAAYAGTPAYSSPEQADCRPVDGKSDQYALGLIVFEMLMGVQAFAAARPHELLRKQIKDSPPRPREIVVDLPVCAERAILRALSKAPEDRFSSCREFARELGGRQNAAVLRHIVATPHEARLGFYISHVADESLLAGKLGRQLERERYSCWFYGRNALPGVSFGSQMSAAIERSQSVLLLISRSAVRSLDFQREIEHAHNVGCPILPLLIDLTREEFEKLAPAWRRMLGASPVLEYRRTEPLDALLGRVIASAQSLGVGTAEFPTIPPVEPPARVNGPSWVTDANQIDILELDRILFRNEQIDDFLTSRHRHFISATKGFGKTLLLTCKRHLLTQTGNSRGQDLTLVPEGRPFLDFMSEMRSLSEKYEKPLSSLSNTKREVRVFLNCLGDVDARTRFLAEIPANILEKDDAIRVCERFNGLEPGSLRHFGEDSRDIHHPFRDLYFGGLLGVVVDDPERGMTTQRFRRPHDPLVHAAAELPDSPVYLIHPALDTFIRSQRRRAPFLQFQHVAVGEDGRTPFARTEVENDPDWRAVWAYEGREDCSEALLWLHELINAL